MQYIYAIQMDMEIDLAAKKRTGMTDTNALTLYRSEKKERHQRRNIKQNK